METVYRVCRINKEGKMISLLAPRQFRLYYNLNEWTEAKPKMLKVGFGITAFKEPGDLLVLLSRRTFIQDKYVAMKCLAELMPVTKRRVFSDRLSHMPVKEFYLLAETIQKGESSSQVFYWPLGTIMCSRVMPIELYNYNQLIEEIKRVDEEDKCTLEESNAQ